MHVAYIQHMSATDDMDGNVITTSLSPVAELAVYVEYYGIPVLPSITFLQ